MPALVAVLVVALPVGAAFAAVHAWGGGHAPAPARHVTIENVAARRPAPVVATAVGDRDEAGVGTEAVAVAADPGLVPIILLATSPGDVAAGGVPSAASGPVSESEPRAVAASPAAARPAFDAWYEAAGVPVEWRADRAAIAMCESRGNPAAVGDGGASLGLHQMWRGWFRAGEDPFDPVTNSAVAARVRATRGRFGGAGGWTCADLLGIA